MAALGAKGSGSFLAGLVDADNTALIGYSMGGYGAAHLRRRGHHRGRRRDRRRVGAGRRRAARPRGGHRARTPPWSTRASRRWCPSRPGAARFGVWDAAALQGIKAPALFVVGDRDQTAPYAGVRFIFEHAVDADRYLLVHQSGDHEVAVNPAPPDHLHALARVRALPGAGARQHTHQQRQPALPHGVPRHAPQGRRLRELPRRQTGATPTSPTTRATRDTPPVSGRASRSGPPSVWRCTTCGRSGGLSLSPAPTAARRGLVIS